MIAEIIPEWYDVEGRKVFRPDSRRKSGFKPTFPAGRLLSQPLQHWCTDLSDLRRFLAGCEYVSDEEQFGERDYWQPPEQFEKSKKGDCEDFALWAWRQLLHMSWPLGLTLPRLSILKYKPRFSMSWDGSKVSYFEHTDRKISWSLRGTAVLVWEWLFFWTSFSLRVVAAATRRITRAHIR